MRLSALCYLPTKVSQLQNVTTNLRESGHSVPRVVGVGGVGVSSWTQPWGADPKPAGYGGRRWEVEANLTYFIPTPRHSTAYSGSGGHLRSLSASLVSEQGSLGWKKSDNVTQGLSRPRSVPVLQTVPVGEIQGFVTRPEKE